MESIDTLKSEKWQEDAFNEPNAKLSYPDQALNSCGGVDGKDGRS
jgi:hypothetical protein